MSLRVKNESQCVRARITNDLLCLKSDIELMYGTYSSMNYK